MRKSNPTQQTQEEILKVIEKSKMPMAISTIAEVSNKSFYQVKDTIAFLKQLGVVKTLVSSGNTTFVVLNKESDSNGKPN